MMSAQRIIPWRRHRRRGAWKRRSRTLPLSCLLQVIPSLPRPILSRLTTRLIDHLDEIDRDPDREDGHDAEEETAYG